MIIVSNTVSIPDEELDISAVRSQGAGGQNVNKVSTAIHLRFDIPASSLPEFYKNRLLNMKDSRLTREGVLVIKSQNHRTQEKNKEAAIERLLQIIREATVVLKSRKPTKPTRGSQRRRVDSKARRGKIKSMRGKVRSHE